MDLRYLGGIRGSVGLNRVGSKQRLRDIMEAERFPLESPELPSGDPRSEKEAAEFRRLLASDRTECRYLYARPEYGKPRMRELPYPGLPKDERGVLPGMIQIIPPSPYLEREALERSVLFFAKNFWVSVRGKSCICASWTSKKRSTVIWTSRPTCSDSPNFLTNTSGRSPGNRTKARTRSASL